MEEHTYVRTYTTQAMGRVCLDRGFNYTYTTQAKVTMCLGRGVRAEGGTYVRTPHKMCLGVTPLALALAQY